MANIGIDVDGVLRNLEKFQLENGKMFFQSHSEGNIDENKMEIQDIFHCTKAESDKFWKKYIFKYCLKEPMVNNASNIIRLLQKKGNTIHIITQHAHTLRNDYIGMLFRTMLEYFLKKNGVKPDSIHYCGTFGQENDKLNVCKNLRIDYMIEDNPDNARIISTYCKVICIKTKYNQNLEINNNILLVNSFSDIYDGIKNFDEIKYGTKIQNIKFFTDKYRKNYNLVRKMGVPIFQSLFHPTILNAAEIPKEGPIIFCGNHLHVWDQFPVICATDRITHWMSKKEYFDSKLGPFFRKTGAICVDRYGDPNAATDEALNYLEIGSAIGIFPEGTRNGLKEIRIKELYENYINEMYTSYESFKKQMQINNPLASHINFLEKLYKEHRITSNEFLESLYNVKKSLNYFLENKTISLEQVQEVELLPFKFGAISMAKKSNALIVPFGVTGEYTRHNNNLTVNFGKPLKVEGDLEIANKILRKKIMHLVQENKLNEK